MADDSGAPALIEMQMRRHSEHSQTQVRIEIAFKQKSEPLM
jgi:hypothetical protein